jgi:hypothetical protein
MRTVLCYGDSITWGYNPLMGADSPSSNAGPVCCKPCSEAASTSSKGLSGRTVATDSWILPHRDSRSMLAPLLESHAPLDWVIIFLGTNDCGPTYRRDVGEIAFGCATLLWIVQKASAGPADGVPQMLLVSPPPSVCSRRSWSFSSAAASDQPRTRGRIRHSRRGVRSGFPRRRECSPSGARRRGASRRGRPAPARRSDRKDHCGMRLDCPTPRCSDR